MTVVYLDEWRRTHVRAHCEAITQAEGWAVMWVRFWGAVQRDAWRQWWRV